MNKHLLFSLAVVFLLFTGCKSDTSSNESVNTEAISLSTGLFPEEAKNLTIYEVNIRQHTAEGTLDAFTSDIPRIKELGSDILWIMPVQPIGLKNRKMSEEELGSYYSIKSYSEINPEFGTLEDFKEMVAKAHELNMYVILDWVPNHTAWDHDWVTDYPEFYAKDDDGNITYEADWTDIALLDHSNSELRSMMIDEMAWWIMETDIDGFRCDHAGHEIPMLFWEEAIPKLNAMKDLFWLAEWDDPKMHPLFHASYNWELHHISNGVAEGEMDKHDIENFIQKDMKRYGKAPYRMTFTTNHDENAWKGTVFERYGDGHKANAVLMWTLPGIPMIYSGQEVGLEKRLKFFTKDTVTWEDPGNLQEFYTSLNSLRKENQALWSGEYGATPEFLKTGNDYVIAFNRFSDNNRVSVIINLSDQAQEVNIPADFGAGMQNLAGGEFKAGEEIRKLDPWQFHILVQ